MPQFIVRRVGQQLKARIVINVSLESQRGFSLLEVILAIGLTIGVVLAATTAVANSLRGSAIADLHMSLNDDALNVLADLRAVSAYDKTMLATLSGRAATMTRNASLGARETISVSVNRAAPAAPAAPADLTVTPSLVATVTVTQAGVTVTQSQALTWEAPAPGSSVNQP